MSKNHFEIYLPEDVKKYGASRAIVLGLIRNWCRTNAKHKQYFFDGYYWSGHITQEQFAEQTGLELKTVKRALKWLLEYKVIEKGRYNKASYDRTGWYRVTGQIVPKVGDKMYLTTGQNVPTDRDKMSLTIPVTPFNSSKTPPITPILGEIEFIELNKEEIDALTPDQRVKYFYKKNEYIKLKKQI